MDPGRRAQILLLACLMARMAAARDGDGDGEGGRSAGATSRASVRLRRLGQETAAREEIDDCTEIMEEADVVRLEIVEEETNVIHSSRVRD